MIEEISLTQLAEQALSDDNVDNFTGNIQSFNELLKLETLIELDNNHKGVYLILAFDPASDHLLLDYIKSGHLANDSPDSLLVLYCLDSVKEEKLNVDIGFPVIASHPAYSFVRSLFGDQRSPILPGFVILSRLSEKSEPIFISLLNTKPDSLRLVCAKVLTLSDQVHKRYGMANFSQNLSLELAKTNLRKEYIRLESTSAYEAFLKFWGSVLHHRKDIISFIKLI